MKRVSDHLGLLGYRVRDVITDIEGVVTSVSFDLTGCVQAIINTGVTPDGKLKEQFWVDTSRLDVRSDVPVMTQPQFVASSDAPIVDSGAMDKPIP